MLVDDQLGELAGRIRLAQAGRFEDAFALVNCPDELLRQAVQREPIYKALVGSNSISPPKSGGNENKTDILSIHLEYC